MGGGDVKPRVHWEVAKQRHQPGGGWQTLYAVKTRTRGEAAMLRGTLKQDDPYAYVRGERYIVRSYR